MTLHKQTVMLILSSIAGALIGYMVIEYFVKPLEKAEGKI